MSLNPASVPDAAPAVAQNLTMVRTGGGGFVTAFPSGLTQPVVSNVNASGPGQVRAALALTRLGGGSEHFFAGNTDTGLIVDVFGWFE